MEVTVKISGIMERFFPEKKFRLVFREEAVLSDVYQTMGGLYGSKISKAVWNHEKNRFRGPVIISSDGRLLKDNDEKLYDGQVIELKRFLIGG